MNSITARTTCWHVTTHNGDVYGVAAAGKREAHAMVVDRLKDAGMVDSPVSSVRCGTWTAPYGTVYAY